MQSRLISRNPRMNGVVLFDRFSFQTLVRCGISPPKVTPCLIWIFNVDRALSDPLKKPHFSVGLDDDRMM